MKPTAAISRISVYPSAAAAIMPHGSTPSTYTPTRPAAVHPQSCIAPVVPVAHRKGEYVGDGRSCNAGACRLTDRLRLRPPLSRPHPPPSRPARDGLALRL
eukprot:scaffold31284_cov108-Isochrysis_galbana.AAC.5